MIAKRSVVLSTHKTSVSLEDEFWRELRDRAKARGLHVNALIEQVDLELPAAKDAIARAERQGVDARLDGLPRERPVGSRRGRNLSSALRLFVLADVQAELARKRAELEAGDGAVAIPIARGRAS